jgi:signal transduction histidine kinase
VTSSAADPATIDLSAAMLALGRALGAGTGPDAVREELARQGRVLGRADAAGVVRVSECGRLWLAATVGMTDDCVERLRDVLLREPTVAARAVAERRPRAVADIGRDAFYEEPALAKAKAAGAAAGFNAVLCVPLIAGDRCLGTLNLYRCDARQWSEQEIAALRAIAEHAAVLIGCAEREDGQRRRVDALLTLSGTLRRSSHEYANRLHVLAGMLALGQEGRAREFLDELVRVHHADGATVVRQIRPAAVAGLLLVQMGVARARGVTLVIDPASSVDALPAGLSDAGAVTIVGNLVDNAIDAAAAIADPARRKVLVRLEQTADEVVLVVRDHGAGVPADHADDLLTLGWSTKRGHAGIGLPLLSDMVAAAGGRLQLRRLAEGTSFTVRMPLWAPVAVSAA